MSHFTQQEQANQSIYDLIYVLEELKVLNVRRPYYAYVTPLIIGFRNLKDKKKCK
jgi:hypothetical protein